MAKGLNVRSEVVQALKRFPLVAGAIAVVIGGVILVLVLVLYLFMGRPGAKQPFPDPMEKAVGPAQAVVGLATCLSSTRDCPSGRNVDEDAGNLVAPVSTVNGRTFANPAGPEQWKRWGQAFMLYGDLNQDSITQISSSDQGRRQTVQVTTDAALTMVCDVTWEDHKLKRWQCYADQTSEKRPQR